MPHHPLHCESGHPIRDEFTHLQYIFARTGVMPLNANDSVVESYQSNLEKAVSKFRQQLKFNCGDMSGYNKKEAAKQQEIDTVDKIIGRPGQLKIHIQPYIMPDTPTPAPKRRKRNNDDFVCGVMKMKQEKSIVSVIRACKTTLESRVSHQSSPSSNHELTKNGTEGDR